MNMLTSYTDGKMTFAATGGGYKYINTYTWCLEQSSRRNSVSRTWAL